MNARPACLGHADLFESEELVKHMEAKAICDACPVMAACQKNLEDTIREYGYGPHVGPRGTWAGKFYAPEATRAVKVSAKERRKSKRANPTPRDVCGTVRGAWRHRHYHERTCEPCKAAECADKAAKRKAAA